MANLLQRTADQLNGPVLGEETENGATFSQENISAKSSPVLYVPLAKLADNPYQPRGTYGADHVAAIAASVLQLKGELPATLGLQQLPLARVVRLNPETDHYEPAPKLVYMDLASLRRQLATDPALHLELMFGHTRLRAFRLLAGVDALPDPLPDALEGLTMPDPDYAYMPVMIGHADDLQMWNHALTENSARKNISPLDEARSLQNAIDQFGLTLEAAGRPLGYANRSTVSNKLRLLRLPAKVQQGLDTGLITERHARELLRLEADPDVLIETFDKASEGNMPVSKLTDMVNWRAKEIEKTTARRQQLEAARAVLVAGWHPPGSAEAVPADRLFENVESWNLTAFETDDSADMALLSTGLCGVGCDCFGVGYVDYPSRTAIRPDGKQAPNVCLGCKGKFAARSEKLEALRTAHAEAIERTPAEIEEEAERAAAKAAREAAAAEARRVFDEGLGKLDRAALWGDIRFWRAMAPAIRYNMADAIEGASGIAELMERMLERAFDCTERWIDGKGRIHDLELVEQFLAALAAPAKPKRSDVDLPADLAASGRCRIYVDGDTFWALFADDGAKAGPLTKANFQLEEEAVAWLRIKEEEKERKK